MCPLDQVPPTARWTREEPGLALDYAGERTWWEQGADLGTADMDRVPLMLRWEPGGGVRVADGCGSFEVTPRRAVAPRPEWRGPRPRAPGMSLQKSRTRRGSGPVRRGGRRDRRHRRPGRRLPAGGGRRRGHRADARGGGRCPARPAGGIVGGSRSRAAAKRSRWRSARHACSDSDGAVRARRRAHRSARQQRLIWATAIGCGAVAPGAQAPRPHTAQWAETVSLR